jgi:hypothetical protein
MKCHVSVATINHIIEQSLKAMFSVRSALETLWLCNIAAPRRRSFCWVRPVAVSEGPKGQASLGFGRVEADWNTSTVALQVVRGDETGTRLQMRQKDTVSNSVRVGPESDCDDNAQ